MNSNQKTVSVIIPYYKAFETIERAVKSAINQTVKPKEIIVINDYSNTKEDDKKLKEISQLDFVKVISLEQNVGCGSARNNGMRQATGDYLAFLDSDDSWFPEKLEVQLKVMAQTNAYFSAHQSAQFEGYMPQTSDDFTVKPIHLLSLLLKNKIPVRSVMMKNDGQFLFKDKMRYVEDLMMWGDLLGNHQKGVFINKVLCFSYKADFGASGLTANLRKMHEGVHYVFRTLYRDKKINKPTFIFVSAFEDFKYQVRRVRVFLRSFINK